MSNDHIAVFDSRLVDGLGGVAETLAVVVDCELRGRVGGVGGDGGGQVGEDEGFEIGDGHVGGDIKYHGLGGGDVGDGDLHGCGAAGTERRILTRWLPSLYRLYKLALLP